MVTFEGLPPNPTIFSWIQAKAVLTWLQLDHEPETQGLNKVSFYQRIYFPNLHPERERFYTESIYSTASPVLTWLSRTWTYNCFQAHILPRDQEHNSLKTEKRHNLLWDVYSRGYYNSIACNFLWRQHDGDVQGNRFRPFPGYRRR